MASHGQAIVPVIVNGIESMNSFPFEQKANGNVSLPHGVHGPPTPAEPPKTPEKSPEKTPEKEAGGRSQTGSPSLSRPSLTDSDVSSLNGFRNRRSRTMPATSNASTVFDSEDDRPHSRTHAKTRTLADEQRAKQYPQIARPVELMRNSYDCVVIGSGYGGSIAASRMARAGQSVCLLELGKERWPGQYPSSTLDAFSELHCSGQFSPGNLSGINVNTGNPTGMYHLILGKGQNAVVCNGGWTLAMLDKRDWARISLTLNLQGSAARA